MEPNHPTDHLLSGVEIDHVSRDHLKSITTWAKIVAIVAIINVAVSIIALFIKPEATGAMLAVSLPIMLIYGAVIVLLNVFLLRFSNQTAASLETQNQQQFNNGISNLRVYWKFVGILLIVVMSFVVLGFMFGILGAMLGGMR